MKLYKFRSFEHIEFTIDIILNQRLYCAYYKNLNDPFEGLFSIIEYSGGGTSIGGGGISCSGGPHRIGSSGINFCGGHRKTVFQEINELPGLVNNTRICSLSSSMSDVRMWSLYASGHAGCVIELDLEPDEKKIVEVKYNTGLQQFKTQWTTNAKAIDIFSFKTDHWEYEKEYRIISEQEFYPLHGRISAIYLGVRINDIHKELVVRCTQKEIPIYETKIQEKNVEIIRKGERIN